MEQPHVLWYDNFSKVYRIHAPTTTTGVYHSCLWTGVALHKYKGPPVDMSVHSNADGEVISVMPPDLLADKDVVLNSIQYLMNQGCKYYDKSLVKKHNVNNIPLKAMINDPQHKENTANTNTMEQVFPLRMIKHNIGSNKGLALIIRELYEHNGMDVEGGCSNYVCLNLDENIFWRVLKVFLLAIYHEYNDHKNTT
jgi:hypothetical protein